METAVDVAVRRLAAEQDGVFRRQQAKDVGATPSLIKERVLAGRWIPIGADAFLMGGAPLTWRARLRAAIWDAGDEALVSHGAAAQLHRFPGFTGNAIEVLVRKSLDHVCTVARVHESRRFALIRSSNVRGIPATRAEETLFHVAPSLRFKRLDWLVDELVAARRVDLGALHRVYVSLSPGCRGLRPLRTVLDDRAPGDPVPESRLERLFLKVADQYRLPPFRRQVPFEGRDRRPGRIDFLWPEVRLIVEADGRRWHTRRADFDRDAAP